MTGHPAPPESTPPPPPREPVQRWRLVLSRAALEPGEAQRSQQVAWEAALTASGLPVAGLDGPRARPRFAAAAPLAAGIPGEAELVDLWLTERLPRWRVREALAAVLPAGHALVDVHDVWLGEAPLPGRVVASVYRALLGPGTDEAALRGAAAALCAATTLPRERPKGQTTVAYDLRPFVEAIEVARAASTPVEGTVGMTGEASEAGTASEASDGGADRRSAPPATIVRMTLRHDPERGVGRPEELLAALGDRTGSPLDVRSVVRERLVLASPPLTDDPPRPRGPRQRPAVAGPRSPATRPR